MIRFKSESGPELEARLLREWQSPRLRGDLRAMVYALSGFAKESFRKDLVVTHVFRTLDEQRDIYGAGTKKISVHMLGRGVDLRDSIYTPAEAGTMLEFVKKHFDYGASHRAMLRHDLGRGSHFHLQVPAGPLRMKV